MEEQRQQNISPSYSQKRITHLWSCRVSPNYYYISLLCYVKKKRVWAIYDLSFVKHTESRLCTNVQIWDHDDISFILKPKPINQNKWIHTWGCARKTQHSPPWISPHLFSSFKQLFLTSEPKVFYLEAGNRCCECLNLPGFSSSCLTSAAFFVWLFLSLRISFYLDMLSKGWSTKSGWSLFGWETCYFI